ncbi:MAG: hypothetical protein WBW33_11360 [Bryobacteraceae bacterium]
MREDHYSIEAIRQIRVVRGIEPAINVMLALKQGGRPAEGSGAGNYRVHQIDATVATEGASLSSVRIDGDNQHLLFRPSLHGKLRRDDFSSG